MAKGNPQENERSRITVDELCHAHDEGHAQYTHGEYPEYPIDELQREAEEMVTLLQNRQSGRAWYESLYERAEKLNNLTSQLLRK